MKRTRVVSPIQTPRLDLVSLSPDFIRASLAGDLPQAERLLGATLPADWPDSAHLLQLRLKQMEEDSAYEAWSLRAMVLRAERVMVGHIGFHTKPAAEYLQPYSPNAVEFGYTVFPPFRRRGYAREASLAVMDWAARVHGQRTFVVSISPDNVASQALAAQLGFIRIGSHIDEVDGLEEILELKLDR
ncbi:MAG: GNAT family N-acetyltransferase [Planctomycetaceae bacterium]|nr:GNAT family N-acetyltransferase [Planctomycetaceae bacterium]